MAIPHRALITRQHAAPLDRLLRARGLAPVHVPLFALVPTGDPPPAPAPTLALVTSAATVRLAPTPTLARLLSGARVVAVGQKTAAALRAAGIVPVAVGASGGAAAAARLGALLRPGDRAGYVGAVTVSAPLSAALSALPVPVVRWAVYDNVVPPDAGRLAPASASVDVVTLTSPSAARRYVGCGGDVGVPAVAIGPTTAAAAAAAGLVVAAVAAAPSMAALAAAAAAAVAQASR